MEDLTTGRIEEYYRAKGYEMTAIRLIEDNFRYRYMDLPKSAVEDLTEKGIYDPKSHGIGELESIDDLPGVIVRNGFREEIDNITIWKTPCGHSRIWSNTLDNIFEDGSILIITGSEGKIYFIDWSDKTIRDAMLTEAYSKEN